VAWPSILDADDTESRDPHVSYAVERAIGPIYPRVPSLHPTQAGEGDGRACRETMVVSRICLKRSDIGSRLRPIHMFGMMRIQRSQRHNGADGALFFAQIARSASTIVKPISSKNNQPR